MESPRGQYDTILISCNASRTRQGSRLDGWGLVMIANRELLKIGGGKEHSNLHCTLRQS